MGTAWSCVANLRCRHPFYGASSIYNAANALHFTVGEPTAEHSCDGCYHSCHGNIALGLAPLGTGVCMLVLYSGLLTFSAKYAISNVEHGSAAPQKVL